MKTANDAEFPINRCQRFFNDRWSPTSEELAHALDSLALSAAKIYEVCGIPVDAVYINVRIAPEYEQRGVPASTIIINALREPKHDEEE